MPRRLPPSSFPPEILAIFHQALALPEHEPLLISGTGNNLIALRHKLYSFRKALQLDAKNPESQRIYHLFTTLSISLRAPDGSIPRPGMWAKLATNEPGWTLSLSRGRDRLLTTILADNPHLQTPDQQFERQFAKRLAAASEPLPSDPDEEPSEFASTLSDYFKPENL